jgi:hypothetical protein
MKRKIIIFFLLLITIIVLTSAVSASTNTNISKTKISHSKTITFHNFGGKWVGTQNTYGIEKYKIEYNGVQNNNQISGIMKYKITWSIYKDNVGREGLYNVKGTINDYYSLKVHCTKISGPQNFSKSFDGTWKLLRTYQKMYIKGSNYDAELSRICVKLPYPWVAGSWYGTGNYYHYKITTSEKYLLHQKGTQVTGNIISTVIKSSNPKIKAGTRYAWNYKGLISHFAGYWAIIGQQQVWTLNQTKILTKSILTRKLRKYLMVNLGYTTNVWGKVTSRTGTAFVTLPYYKGHRYDYTGLKCPKCGGDYFMSNDCCGMTCETLHSNVECNNFFKLDPYCPYC